MTETTLEGLPPATEHGDIIHIAHDVHYVEGTAFMQVFSFPRGMTVVKSVNGDGLVVINAVRLSETAEARLCTLGSISHVIRIGMHDIDTAYYVRKFGAKLWGYTTKTYKHGVKIDFDLDIETSLPITNCELIKLEHLPPKYAEAVVLLKRPGGNILVTCDAIQHHPVPRGNLACRLITPWMGFNRGAIIGPMWMKTMQNTMDEPEKLRDTFEKLCKYEFKYLLTAHGYCLDGAAKETYSASLKQTFSS